MISKRPNLILSLFESRRPEPWLDSLLKEDISHLRPAHPREIRRFGQGKPFRLIARYRQTYPGVGASPEQMTQSIANDLLFAAVEPSFDKILGFSRARYGDARRSSAGIG